MLRKARLIEHNLRRLRELHRDDDARRGRTLDSGGAGPRLDRSHLARLLGLHPEPPRTPLRTRTVGSLERDGYRIEKLVFESRPGMPVPASLYLPSGSAAPQGPWPAVLCPVGHWGLSKAEPVVQARAVGFAKLGLAALVYDALGQGERAIPGNEHDLAYLAALVGHSNMTYMVWDSIRALDLLESRAEIDKDRLGVTGCSGGGLNTLYLIGLERRLKAAAPVGYVCSFRSFFDTGITHCPCSHVPFVARDTDMGEIASLFAPNPLLVVGGSRDPMFTETGMREAFREIRQRYRSAGARARPELFVDDCGHDYSRPMRERAYAFFLRHLAAKEPALSVPEPMEATGWKAEPPEALFCFEGGKVPVDSTTYLHSVLAALERGEGGALAERVEDVSKAPPPTVLECHRLADPTELELWVDAEELLHRELRRPGDPGGAFSIVLIEDAGLLDDTLELVAVLSATGAREVVALEPPLWGLRGNQGHLATTNGLLTGRPPAALWARALRSRLEQLHRPVVVARGPCSSTTALVASALSRSPPEGLVAVGAPESWPDLVAPANSAPAALLPGAGGVGTLARLLAARAPHPTLWCGAPEMLSGAEGVELRERDLTEDEIVRWLQELLPRSDPEVR